MPPVTDAPTGRRRGPPAERRHPLSARPATGPVRSAAGRPPDLARRSWRAGVPSAPDRRRALVGRRAVGGDARTLPAALRVELDTAFRFDALAETDWQAADAGLTEKALHRLSDGALVESVLMHYPARTGHRERHTVCISSQAGCAVGCPFCATGELGFSRDLETAEIVDQVRSAARRLAGDGRRLTNVVFMGMGEPLLNLDRVLEAVTALADPQPVRARRPTHHDQHERSRAGHPAPDRARPTVHPRGEPARCPRSAAGRARAAEFDAGPSPRSSRPRAITPRRPAGGSRTR